MGDTLISWTDKTWNPIRGCSRVSPGCENCYAERVAGRFSGPGQAYEGLARGRASDYHGGTGAPRAGGVFRWTGEVRVVLERLADPLHWKKPRRIFVNSMSDLFHAKLTNEQIAAIFGVMAACPQHTFQVLTKRPERMVEWFNWVSERGYETAAVDHHASWWSTLFCGREAAKVMTTDFGIDGLPWPLPNVWIGVTAEDQQRVDERVPLLLRTPAAKRFVSVEPQLGPVTFPRFTLGAGTFCRDCDMGGVKIDEDGCCTGCGCDAAWYGVDWVICGCESGPHRRPMEIDWARSIRDQCSKYGAKFFLKQLEVGGKVQSEPPPLLDGVQHVEFP